MIHLSLVTVKKSRWFATLTCCLIGCLTMANTALAQGSPEENKVIALINEYRAKYELPAVSVNATLMKLARSHSKTMADRKIFDHFIDGKSPVDRGKAVGYNTVVNENIAAGQDTTAKLFKAWQNSEVHNKNMLSVGMNEIGVGLAKNAEGVPYWTMVGGFRSNAAKSNPTKATPAKAFWNDSFGPSSGGVVFAAQGFLKDDSPFDTKRQGARAAIFTGELRGGRVYTIELSSKNFDTYLRLEDAAGKQVAENDDVNKDNLNSRLQFRSTATGTYKIIVTSFAPNQKGLFTLKMSSTAR